MGKILCLYLLTVWWRLRDLNHLFDLLIKSAWFSHFRGLVVVRIKNALILARSAPLLQTLINALLGSCVLLHLDSHGRVSGSDAERVRSSVAHSVLHFVLAGDGRFSGAYSRDSVIHLPFISSWGELLTILTGFVNHCILELILNLFVWPLISCGYARKEKISKSSILFRCQNLRMRHSRPWTLACRRWKLLIDSFRGLWCAILLCSLLVRIKASWVTARHLIIARCLSLISIRSVGKPGLHRWNLSISLAVLIHGWLLWRYLIYGAARVFSWIIGVVCCPLIMIDLIVGKLLRNLLLEKTTLYLLVIDWCRRLSIVL